MKKIFILHSIVFLVIQTACETTLPADISEDEEWGITLNAVASPDTTFSAYVTRCYPNWNAPEYAYKNEVQTGYWEPAPYLDYYHSMLYQNHDSIPFNSSKGYDLIKKSVLADAKVELTVNDATNYPMVFDTLMLCFQSNYRPMPGDRIEVRISDTAGKQTVARTEVPHPQKLEILDVNTEILWTWMQDSTLNKIVISGDRSCANIRLRLHDPAGEKNYYRLVVRGYCRSLILPDSAPDVWDTYSSSDPIFRDERLTSEWGQWDAFFSDVFDDSLFNGTSYEFDIKAHDGGWYNSEWPSYLISLQSITEDYYHYLKSLQLYRITRTDAYNEGVYFHSNNEGGWGVLGGITGGEVHWINPSY